MATSKPPNTYATPAASLLIVAAMLEALEAGNVFTTSTNYRRLHCASVFASQEPDGYPSKTYSLEHISKPQPARFSPPTMVAFMLEQQRMNYIAVEADRSFIKGFRL
jgi:hypothetical protein